MATPRHSIPGGTKPPSGRLIRREPLMPYIRRLAHQTHWRPMAPGSAAHIAQMDAGTGDRRASRSLAWAQAMLTPDKAKGQQRQTVDLSAPRIPSDGTPGVENKYSR